MKKRQKKRIANQRKKSKAKPTPKHQRSSPKRGSGFTHIGSSGLNLGRLLADSYFDHNTKHGPLHNELSKIKNAVNDVWGEKTNKTQFAQIVRWKSNGPYNSCAEMNIGERERDIAKCAKELMLAAHKEHGIFPELNEDFFVTSIILPVEDSPCRFTSFVTSSGRLIAISEPDFEDLELAQEFLLSDVYDITDSAAKQYSSLGLEGFKEQPYLYLIFPKSNGEIDAVTQYVTSSPVKEFYSTNEQVKDGKPYYDTPVIDVITKRNAPNTFRCYKKYRDEFKKNEKLWNALPTKILHYPLYQSPGTY